MSKRITSADHLRAQAEQASAQMPALLAKADQLARGMMMGGHGRKRAGRGGEFWQYRPAQAGDPARSIDWRRSGQSDEIFVREHEWQSAQSVHFWCDRSASMQFSSLTDHTPKMDRAAVLTLALSMVLMDGGERVALDALGTPPRRGADHLRHMAQALCEPQDLEHGTPDVAAYQPQAHAVFVSDFLGPIAPIERAVSLAVERGMRGVLLQILDPAEEAFPYQGRTVFTSMGGAVSHETLRAGDLKSRYLDRLVARKDALQHLATQAGWHYGCHHTDAPARVGLSWVFHALDGGAR